MIEVIVFGKGYGESILIHLENKWIVVDSFVVRDNGVDYPVAIKYLQDNGYSIEDIIGVICTHWDNDHILGIRRIIELHSDGLALCLPIVYSDSKFLEYVSFNSDSAVNSTGEFFEVLKLIKPKKVKRLYAIAGRNIFEKTFNGSGIYLKVLSPNDNQFSMFLDSISTPENGQIKRDTTIEENKISVVTYIKTCMDSILLGGDMENSQDGWKSICSNFTDDKCHIYKIPHHGSENGNNKNVWETMVDCPISIITRFNLRNLPTEEMVKRISLESSAVYVVGPKPRKDRKTIKQAKRYGDFSTVGTTMTELDFTYGYVKLSKANENDNWTVNTFGAVEKYDSENGQ